MCEYFGFEVRAAAHLFGTLTGIQSECRWAQEACPIQGEWCRNFYGLS